MASLTPQPPVSIALTPEGAAQLAAVAKRFGDKAGYDKAMLRAAGRQATLAVGRIRASAFSGQIIKRRTGHLAQSLEGKAGVVGTSVVMRAGVYAGPTLAYAAAQERGASIAPHPPRRYLTVPTDAGGVLTPAGVKRFAKARDFPGGLTLVTGGRFSAAVGGKTITSRAALFPTEKVERARERAKIGGTTVAAVLEKTVPAYLLLRHTTIPARAPIRKGMERELPAIVAGIEADLIAHYATVAAPPAAGGATP